MINKNFNLLLKLNKADFPPPGVGFGSNPSPFTPVDQTMKTPLDAPQQSQIFPMVSQQGDAPEFSDAPGHNSIYQNPRATESDDILTDIDEPNGFTKRSFTLFFTNHFDQVLLTIYTTVLSLPTTTPFLGNIPPSGLVSRVANETIKELIKNTATNGHPAYDQFNIINRECLKSHEYQPIILQLIRKRLLELCHSRSNSNNKLPESTSIQVNGSAMRSSVSNLSLNEANLMNYNSSSNSAVNLARSRSSSINLRKQSLTRNNSNNWLHVGNISNLRPTGNPDFNISTDSLQSMQDYVPQSMINKTSNNNNASMGQLNSMMMDYHITPPTSHKGSVSSAVTPPYSIVQNPASTYESEEFYFLQRSRSSSRGNNLPHALNINTDMPNLQALNSLQGIPNGNPRSAGGIALDSPFLSATTPGDEYFPGFPVPNSNSSNATTGNGVATPSTPTTADSNCESSSSGDAGKINIPNQYSLSEKKRDSLKMKRGIH
ncbi:hypothetical protein Cantr_09108 [Candida viswanathii]|uniref:Uncharacterized protein n=1 Tax=Candida viswanathii TaxID=5486 RepID=A0A367Y903_9ASCO|nr:hypothetical protein Cantr_09108 [Candida viswanathii]